MTGRVFEWVKLFVENGFISKNKWLILLLIGGLTAGGVQEFRYWDYTPKDPTQKPVDTAAIIDLCKKYTDKQQARHLRSYHP